MNETVQFHTLACLIANRKGWERLEYVENKLILRCRRCGTVRESDEAPRYSLAVDWGKVRFWTDRLSWYPQKAQWIVTFLIWFELTGISYWWLMLSLPLIPVLYVFEKKKVTASELSQYTHHNTALKDLIEKGKTS